jgi:hypothetical protein
VVNIEQPRPVKAPKQHANLRRDKRDDVAVAVVQIKSGGVSLWYFFHGAVTHRVGRLRLIAVSSADKLLFE